MRIYECVECGEESYDCPNKCECGCTSFQVFMDGFDADELGIDPELDAERYENA